MTYLLVVTLILHAPATPAVISIPMASKAACEAARITVKSNVVQSSVCLEKEQ